MADIKELTAEPRDRAGKGAARATRRAGQIPCVIYGDKKPPISISVERLALNRLIKDPAFTTSMLDVTLTDAKHRVLPRDVQYHPVTDEVEHIDFLRISDKTTVYINVPVQFLNEEASPGIKRGGVLNVVRYEVELVCRADSIPDHLTVDLTGWNVGESIHISAVTLPAGVRPAISDRDFTIATIAAPTGMAAEAGEEAAEEA